MGGLSLAAGIGGGIMGGKSAKKAAQAQAAAIAAAMAQAQAIIDQVGLPPDQSAPVILEQLELAGVLTPELEELVKLGPSGVAAIQEAPAIRDAQVRALHEISKRGRAGLTAEERAEANLARQGVQRDLQAKESQIVNEMAMRGQAGGGAELAQRMLASQAGAERASEEADRIQALAASRALQAIQSEGQMASQLRGQDFDIARAKAGAQDEFDRFNIQNQIATQSRNVGARNVAQEANLGNKQRIQDSNTSMKNSEKYAQLERERNFWNDKMRQAEAKASIITGGMGAQAQAAGGADRAKADMWSGIGGAASSAFGGLSNYYGQQSKSPTTVTSNNSSTPMSDDLQRQFDSYKAGR